MKKMKKLIAVLLAAVMILGMNLNVFATEPDPLATTGSITIEDYISGQTYDLYLMFELESYQGAAYSYKLADGWEGFVLNDNAASPFFELYGADNQYVRLKEGVSMTDSQKASLALAAVRYAENNGITAAHSLTPTTGISGSNSVTGVTLGYYAMNSNVGSICSLTTTAPNATIYEKNTQPTVNKEVWEDLDNDGVVEDNEWGSVNDAQIGDTVYYKTTIQAMPGAHNYVLHDRMSAGLTLNKDSIKVYMGGVELTGEKILSHEHTNGKDYYDDLYQDKAYYVFYDHESHDAATEICDFEVHLMNNLFTSITTEVEITVTYNATLNRSANIYDADNINATKLQYADDNYTEMIKTSTYTYMMDVIKTDEAGNKLSGATFALYKSVKEGTDGAETLTLDANGTTVLAKKVDLISNGDLTYTVSDGTTTATVGSFVAGDVEIRGLDVGTYYLVETSAPAGYNKVEYPIEITFTRNEKFESSNKMGSNGITVVNKTGTLLPETGGTGRTILYAAGSIFTVAAIVVIVTKKRMKHEE